MRKKLSLIFLLTFLIALAFLASNVATGWSQSKSGQKCGESADSLEGCNTVEGASFNQVEAGVAGATISGGGTFIWPNWISGDYGTVCGGLGNQAGLKATVCGGYDNQATVLRTFVGGGMLNAATADSAVIVGGLENLASGRYAFVGGGFGNQATDLNSTVGGGSGNLAGYRRTTVAGGSANQAISVASTVGGGVGNISDGAYSTIGGGTANLATSLNSTISGGAGNQVSSDGGTISGGINNRVTDNYGVVTGGRSNLAGDGDEDLRDAAYTVVGGGQENIAGGSYATVPGGASNRANGDYSLAAGRRAVVQDGHDGSILFADSSNADFSSLSANEFAVRATGGVRLLTAIDAAGNPLAGAFLPSGSGSWTTLSDRESKTAFVAVERQEILSRLAAIPIKSWSYIAQAGDVRHIGPAAQDFYAAFGLGEGDKTISVVDADGVALASIQALYDQLQKKETEIAAIKAENRELQEQMNQMENRVSALEAGRSVSGNPLPWIGVIVLTALIKNILEARWRRFHRLSAH